MSEEAQDQIIGKLVRERRSAQLQLDTLRREGKNLGAKFKELSENMDSNIQRVWLQRDNENPPSERMIKVKMSDVNGEALATLTDEIRATQVAVSYTHLSFNTLVLQFGLLEIEKNRFNSNGRRKLPMSHSNALVLRRRVLSVKSLQ